SLMMDTPAGLPGCEPRRRPMFVSRLRSGWLCLTVVSALAALFIPAGAAFAASGEAPGALMARAADHQGPGGEVRADKSKKDKEDAAAGDKDKKEGKDGEKKDDKEEPKEPAFEKLVKGAKEVKGLFHVYIKEDDAKYYLEVAPDQ